MQTNFNFSLWEVDGNFTGSDVLPCNDTSPNGTLTCKSFELPRCKNQAVSCKSIGDDPTWNVRSLSGNIECNWGPWINSDFGNPSGGDYESVTRIKDKFGLEFCSEIKGFKSRRLNDKVAANLTGQKLAANNASMGLICHDSDQDPAKLCEDYEVQFCCEGMVLMLKERHF